MTRAEQISRVYDQLKELQLSKNADYGNSAFDDVEVSDVFTHQIYFI